MHIISNFLTRDSDVLDTIHLYPKTAEFLHHQIAQHPHNSHVAHCAGLHQQARPAATTIHERAAKQLPSPFNAVNEELVSKATNIASQCHHTANTLFESLTGENPDPPSFLVYSNKNLMKAFDQKAPDEGKAYLCHLMYFDAKSKRPARSHSFFIIQDKENRFRLYQSMVHVYSLDDWLSGKLNQLDLYQRLCLNRIEEVQEQKKPECDIDDLRSLLHQQQSAKSDFYHHIVSHGVNGEISSSDFYEKIILPLSSYLVAFNCRDAETASDHHARLTGVPLEQDKKTRIAKGNVVQAGVSIQSAPLRGLQPTQRKKLM